MAKIFVAVESGTQNDKMICQMAQKPMVKNSEFLPGALIDVDGWNFYCLDYGEAMKLNEIKKIGQALQIHKKVFGDKGVIYRIMIAGNNVTMDRFLEEAIEEVEDEEEENGEEDTDEENDAVSVAVSDADTPESVGVDSGMP